MKIMNTLSLFQADRDPSFLVQSHGIPWENSIRDQRFDKTFNEAPSGHFNGSI